MTITAAALIGLSRKLVIKQAADDAAIRTIKKTKCWKLHMDRIRPADTAISHDGRYVLLLNNALMAATAHMTMDLKDTKNGQRSLVR